MAVIVDIPLVGSVEAKNAASEATLKEILAVMKSVQGNTKNQGGGGGGGGNGATPLTAIGKLGQSLGKLSSVVTPVIGGFSKLSGFLTNTISNFADVSDSVERAAATIPIFGDALSKIAGASVKLNNSFLEASKSGAGFGGSVNELARSASEAGMTLEKFGQFIAQNGQGMLGFGASTEEGAKRFTQVSRALRETSSDLYALGFSSEDINKGLANYGSLLRLQGLQGRQSNAELVAGAKRYMKELDSLAKITGEERSAKEAEMKKLATDAQFAAAMAGKDETVRASFQKTVLSLPGPLQGFVKDFLATGTLTTEETQRIGAMMGGEVMNELQSMRNKMNAGQALTAAEQDRLALIMKTAAEKQLKANSAALAASRENDAATSAMVSATQLQTDAHKKAAAEQGKAAKEGDGFNKKMQEIQQRLAQFSNAFTQVLANSGVLDTIMGAFTVMANLVMTFIVPAFNIFTSVLTTVGQFIGNTLYPAFLQLAAFVQIDVIPKLKAIGETITPVFQTLGGLIKDYVYPVFQTIGSFISDNLVPIFYGLAASLAAYAGYLTINKGLELARNGITAAQNAMQIAATMGLSGLAKAALAASLPFLKIALPILALVGIFKLLYDAGFTFESALETLTDGFLRLLNKVSFGKYGIDEEEYKRRSEKREEEKKKIAEERKAGSDRKEREAAAAKLDKKIMGGKEKYADTIEKSNKTIDMNSGPEALAKQFAESEGSYLIPKDKKDAAAKADATKKEIETKAEEKSKAEEKAKEETKKEIEKSPAAPTQESAESLLAQLNTNMTRLVKIASEQKDIGERQLGVQRSLSGDLFAA